MVLLNTIVLLLLVNAPLFLFYSIKDSLAGNKPTGKYLPPIDKSRWGALEQVYPDLNRAEITPM